MTYTTTSDAPRPSLIDRVSNAELAVSAGLAPLETGGLASARYLEPLAGLNIALAYGLGQGTDIAPTWQRAA